KRPGHIYVSAPLIRAFYLSTHLEIPNNPGIQANSHLKKMAYCVLFVERNKITVDVLRDSLYDLQPAEQFSAVIGFRMVIDLCSVAGGNYQHIGCCSIFLSENQQLLYPLLI